MERLPPYDLVDLRLLLALAEHKHFARAADACGLSQPALSARIRRLETALDTPLIFRGKRFEGFTPDGERVLGWARRVLSDCAALVQDVRNVDGGPRGTLRLGVVPSATPFAGRLSGAIATRYPNLQPQVLSLSSTAIKAGLADFSLDAGISYLDCEGSDLPVEPAVTATPLFVERYCLVAGHTVIATDGASLTWTEAAKLPMCLLTSDMQNRRIIDEAFHRVGAAPEPRFESNSFNAILALVRNHDFATILPRLQVEAGVSDDLRVWDLVEPEVRARIGLLVPNREPVLPVTAALLDLIADWSADPDQPG